MDLARHSPLDPLVYRDLVGRFPTGVTVVSARSPSGVRMMTANSFTSVSLEPMLVLVCIELSARFHAAVVAAGQWGVSVLAADQEPLSRLFANHGSDCESLTVPHRLGALTGAPLLDGAVVQMECRTVAEHPGGDHTILIGAVLDGAVTRDDIGPLVFYRGGYTTLAT
ncbi:MAG: flavin reductase family protein [Actinomycetota bacterium]|nr:flavin reductase family protein [Actinomycetota bacterium]